MADETWQLRIGIRPPGRRRRFVWKTLLVNRARLEKELALLQAALKHGETGDIRIELFERARTRF